MNTPAPRNALEAPAEPVARNRLRRDQAAAYLRDVLGIPITVDWLAKAAVKGDGPAMVYFRRTPLYEVERLRAWAAQRLTAPVCSTAERQRLTENQ